MQFDKRTVSVFELVQRIKRKEIILKIEMKDYSKVDWSFVIDNGIPVSPVYVSDDKMILGSNLISSLYGFMEGQEGAYLRKVQDFPITLYVVKGAREEELEKLIRLLNV